MSGIKKPRLSEFIKAFTLGDAEVKVATAYIPAAAAADATKSWPVFFNNRKVEVQWVKIVPQAAITGADTNSANWNLINTGTDGTGTTELANKDFTSGKDAAAMDAINLYTPSGGKELAAGSVLALQREKAGNGLALPEALVVVGYVDILDILQ